MKKIIFLDQDWAINLDADLRHTPGQIRLKKITLQNFQALSQKGYNFVIVKISSGSTKTRESEENIWLLNNMAEILVERGIKILQANYYAQLLRARNEKDKPFGQATGTNALEEFEKSVEIDKEHSWIIGDNWLNVKTGSDFGIGTVLIQPEKIGADYHYKTEAYFIAKDLSGAARYILESE